MPQPERQWCAHGRSSQTSPSSNMEKKWQQGREKDESRGETGRGGGAQAPLPLLINAARQGAQREAAVRRVEKRASERGDNISKAQHSKWQGSGQSRVGLVN